MVFAATIATATHRGSLCDTTTKPHHHFTHPLPPRPLGTPSTATPSSGTVVTVID